MLEEDIILCCPACRSEDLFYEETFGWMEQIVRCNNCPFSFTIYIADEDIDVEE